MFGLDFLFATALFALPVAGAPLLLHLLFRRKSPTVQFPTLRFIRASVQQTAARRKLHRWLLLACRILLLALLIWAVAQPVKRLRASWTGGSRSTIAAIVVDTSYSMQLRDADVPLLAVADRAVQDLLRNELQDAKVAVYTSGKDDTVRLRGSSEILSEWTPLTSQPSEHPLSDRVSAARELLARNAADQKWLIVLSDLQSREFSRPIENNPDQRQVWIDLHPQTARSAGIVGVSLNPAQPIPGVGSEVAIDVAGHTGDSRTVTMRVLKPDGSVLQQPPPVTVSFDAGGRASARLPLKLPAEPWLLVEAAFPEPDDMPWDDSRTTLVALPQKQFVRVTDLTRGSSAARFVTLALDPSEGKSPAWPLSVRAGSDVADDDQSAVVLVSSCTDQRIAERLAQFAAPGHTVIVFVQPGLESTWKTTGEAPKSAWLKLLPSEPSSAAISSPAKILPPGLDDPLHDLTDGVDLKSAIVRRLVRFDPPRDTQTLLQVSSNSTRLGLLFSKRLGAGRVITVATLPDPIYTNLPTHPIFLPLMVRLALQTAQQENPLNVELGQPIVQLAKGIAEVTIESPTHEKFQVPRSHENSADRFIFRDTQKPGLYIWRAAGKIIGYTNVQPPAAESELVYRSPDQVAPRGDNIIVARSLIELRGRMQQLAEPEPKWSGPIAIVLILLCVEALLGSLTAGRATAPAPAIAYRAA